MTTKIKCINSKLVTKKIKEEKINQINTLFEKINTAIKANSFLDLGQMLKKDTFLSETEKKEISIECINSIISRDTTLAMFTFKRVNKDIVLLYKEKEITKDIDLLNGYIFKLPPNEENLLKEHILIEIKTKENFIQKEAMRLQRMEVEYFKNENNRNKQLLFNLNLKMDLLLKALNKSRKEKENWRLLVENHKESYYRLQNVLKSNGFVLGYIS